MEEALTHYFHDIVIDPRFPDDVIEVEGRVVADVSLVTGDREFPEEMREKIQRIIAVERLAIGKVRNEGAMGYLRMTGCSALLEELHGAFRDVAQCRIRTRFGILSDSPGQILAAREHHDAGVQVRAARRDEGME